MAALNWSAPVARPIPIDKKIYVSSSGSFIGVLNLTIDKAPTSPRESAKEDFTTAIIIVVPILKIGNTLAKDSGLLIVEEFFLYTFERINDKKKDKSIEITKELDDSWSMLFKSIPENWELFGNSACVIKKWLINIVIFIQK